MFAHLFVGTYLQFWNMSKFTIIKQLKDILKMFFIFILSTEYPILQTIIINPNEFREIRWIAVSAIIIPKMV